MFINPKVAIDKGWVTGIANPDTQIQPNALDFPLDKLHHVRSESTFVISEEGKEMRGTTIYEPIVWRRDPTLEYWMLNAGRLYDGLSDMFVSLPDGVAALLFTRSTFERNGVYIRSGLYDSGFEGHIGFTVHNLFGSTKVFTGTRIGQIAFVHSENAMMYAGGYNHEAGTDAPHMD